MFRITQLSYLKVIDQGRLYLGYQWTGLTDPVNTKRILKP